MPLTPTPKPQYPNLPSAPGVPPLLRQVGEIQNTVVLLFEDAKIVLSAFDAPQWGLFNVDGSNAFAAPVGGTLGLVVSLLASGNTLSTGSVEFSRDSRISTAPQELGSFLSYNKVADPFSGRISYVVSGSLTDRQQFLSKVMNGQTNLTLYTLVMPEYMYLNCNIVHHDFRRTARDGVSMMMVDIWLEEVRFSSVSAFSNTQTPAGADQTNNGPVQPQPPTPAQSVAAGKPPS